MRRASKLQYVPVRAPNLNGSAIAGFEHFDVLALPWKAIAQKHRLPDGIEAIKRSRSRLVLATTFHGERLFVKRGVSRTLKHQLSSMIQGPKLRREFHVAREFLALGVIVPEPVFYAEGKDGATYLATRAFPHSWLPLDEIFKRDGISTQMLQSLAQYTKWLHNLPAYHHDFRSDHIYIADTASPNAPVGNRFALLDLDGAFTGRVPSLKQRREATGELFQSLARRNFSLDHARSFMENYSPQLNARERYESSMNEYRRTNSHADE